MQIQQSIDRPKFRASTRLILQSLNLSGTRRAQAKLKLSFNLETHRGLAANKNQSQEIFSIFHG